MKAKFRILAVIGGVVVTLVTGLFVNTPEGIVGAVHYGYPMPWLERLVISPDYFPWKVYEYLGLIMDIVVWAIVMGVIIFAVTKTMKK